MTLKQVEPVECGEMNASVFFNAPPMVIICDKYEAVGLTEPEARALLEFLRKVCE